MTAGEPFGIYDDEPLWNVELQGGPYDGAEMTCNSDPGPFIPLPAAVESFALLRYDAEHLPSKPFVTYAPGPVRGGKTLLYVYAKEDR